MVDIFYRKYCRWYNCYYEKIGNNIKNISDEIPFEIPKNWIWIRLNEIGSFRKGPFGSSLTKDMFVSENTMGRKKVYEQKNAIQKDYSLGNYYISKEKFKSMQSFIAEPGDIIVSCAGTIGEIYVLPNFSEIGIINQALMRIKLYIKCIEQYFILYFDSVLKKEANEKGKGTGMKNIPPFNVLKNMLLPLPPEKEIGRIVNQLNIVVPIIDDISSKCSDLKKNIEKTKYKILDYYFGENSCYKSYYQHEKDELQNICKKITKGSTPTTYGFDFLDNGISFIKVENVKNHHIDNESITCYISDDANEFQKRSQLKENDVLFSIAGKIGRTCIVTKENLPANTNQAFAIISEYEKIKPKYLLYFLEYSKLSIDSHGGGMMNATLGGLKTLNIWYPISKNIQEKIIYKIENSFELLNTIIS